MWRHVGLAAGLLALTTVAGGAHGGQPISSPPAEDFPRGVIVPRVACASDPSQTYSLFLPADMAPGSRRPLLLVFDPRRGGARAAEIFRPAAARFGWILMSSNDTISDGPTEPNERALRAMWSDAFSRGWADPGRVYAAGLSGLAPAAVSLGLATGKLAGVIAVGGRFTGTLRERVLPFPIFGAAGVNDFNALEMKDLEARQATGTAPHRFEFFTGGHEWLPPALAEQALWWFEMLAMRTRPTPPDTAAAAEWRTAELSPVDRWEMDGHLVDAVGRLRLVADTLDGLVDVAPERARIATHERGKELSRERRDQERWDDWSRQELVRLNPRLVALMSNDDVAVVGRAEDQLGLAALRSQAKATTYAGASARRVLSSLFTQLSFYLWRQQMTVGAWTRAAFLQRVALRIDDAPVAWFRLAMTYSAARDRSRALSALEDAVSRGFASPSAFDEDDLAALRGDPVFEQLRAKVAARAVKP